MNQTNFNWIFFIFLLINYLVFTDNKLILILFTFILKSIRENGTYVEFEWRRFVLTALDWFGIIVHIVNKFESVFGHFSITSWCWFNSSFRITKFCAFVTLIEIFTWSEILFYHHVIIMSHNLWRHMDNFIPIDSINRFSISTARKVVSTFW